MPEEKQPFYPDQIIPLILTVVVFFVMVGLLFLEVFGLNRFVIAREQILIHLSWTDIAVGMTIYLKTSIDFAIFIGRLMSKFPGWKNRIMIEIGTAFGNALGTFAILLLWDLFREVRFLMAAMILIASLVLLRLAEEGLDHVKDAEGNYRFALFGFVRLFEKYLSNFNRALAPVLNKIVPRLSIADNDLKTGFKALFFLSFSVPFILGLDDFAGYIPLFNVVNVFGFSIGVFLGHMLLNIFLFLSPKRTIAAVKQPVISFLGSLAFVVLAIIGLIETAKLVGFLPHGT
ncbi:MAG: hypothetical protein COU63_02085 [Candidatus Pacebacteria bacterium CG10_big_fil_rev_8_21_14_0_10_36_11]|nr:hypothetical protein [Candidatus Pacearchaeota archaeon]OIP73633.1 MAG: hypothetical protein AUK08_03640 [Candidatus Pacebacteria bacterium CG2_30_36_39]PIR64785.1 MAG: hypothetical protein COU63_02085 [Candidatus Pacebacteria bacterium CG10_big_fil_rev_8_21_14_0_10_36_11]PJC43138.1 MAG: hypothetical protein CO040_00770 [Candidatus Pacebacteria bacterium CG_4_9_14_0_2_um_filter_36_8]